MELGGELSGSDIAKCSLAQQLDRFTNERATGVNVLTKGKKIGEPSGGMGKR